MGFRFIRFKAAFFLFPFVLWPASAAAQEFKAGFARVVITPERPIWLAGYASRNKPSEGKVHDLHARAFALEDRRGTRVVLVNAEVIGFPRPLTEAIERRVAAQHRVKPNRLLLTASHTHTGPVLRHSLIGMYGLSEEQGREIERYSGWLEERIVEVVGKAIADLAPARLSFTRTSAEFGVNRRVPSPTGIRFGANTEGPTDPDVPILRIDAPDGRLRGLVFGYACHNTTFRGDAYRISGDYSGVAQARLEASHPGAVALYVMGAGADIDPQPNGTLEHVERHGATLARAVNDAITGRTIPVNGRLRVRSERLMLPIQPPSAEELKKRLSEQNAFRRKHAERNLARLDKEGTLATKVPYTIQTLQFGRDLTIIALTGEVVVDYVRRLKKELSDPTWVVAYSHDVPAYIPSVRILKEGGYEADFSMMYYDWPGSFKPEIEDRIIRTVHKMIGSKEKGKR
jgi:neutral ceramidase